MQRTSVVRKKSNLGFWQFCVRLGYFSSAGNFAIGTPTLSSSVSRLCTPPRYVWKKIGKIQRTPSKHEPVLNVLHRDCRETVGPAVKGGYSGHVQLNNRPVKYYTSIYIRTEVRLSSCHYMDDIRLSSCNYIDDPG